MAKTKAVKKKDETTPQKDIEVYDRYIAPDVDIYETENDYVIIADMPGIARERLDIKLDRNDLRITGNIPRYESPNENFLMNECCRASFHRHFTIADDVDRDKVEAKLENGVLRLVLPKKETYKPREIKVN